jgi:hypothetical protein
MKNINMLGVMLALGVEMPSQRRKAPQKKECLNCDKIHNHNNSFCSAQCCKEYTPEEDPLIERENQKTLFKNRVKSPRRNVLSFEAVGKPPSNNGA